MIVAAAVAAVIAAGLLSAVTVMFQSSGAPFADAVAAERACADRTYVSERERCMRDWITASRRHAVASN